MGDGRAGATGGGDGVNRSHVLFDNFVQASTCKGTLKAFQELCDHLEVKPTESRIFYHKLKSKLNYWKAKALWAKLDKRAALKEYKKGRACANSKVSPVHCGLYDSFKSGSARRSLQFSGSYSFILGVKESCNVMLMFTDHTGVCLIYMKGHCRD